MKTSRVCEVVSTPQRPFPCLRILKGALHYEVVFNFDEQEASHQSNTHCMRAGWWREVLAVFWDEGVQLQG